MKVSKPSTWYRLRNWAASHFYHEIGFGRAQRIRFGKIVKVQCDMAEVEAAVFVRENTTIPVPKIIGLYQHGDEIDMVLEVVEGRTLDVYWQKLTLAQKEDVVRKYADISNNCAISCRQMRGLDQ